MNGVNAMKKVSEVWFVIGDDGNIPFADKLSAEKYARELYPTEPPHNRYARIYTRMVYEIKEGEKV